MNKKELREYIKELVAIEAGSIREWAKLKKISFSYVSAVIRGDAPAGNKILKAAGLRKSYVNKKPTVVPKYN